MKKALIIVGIILVVLISAMVAIPYLFRDQIIQFVKDDANKNITATLDFDDLGLSFFRQFPRLTLTLDQPRLINQAPFCRRHAAFPEAVPCHHQSGQPVGR